MFCSCCKRKLIARADELTLACGAGEAGAPSARGSTAAMNMKAAATAVPFVPRMNSNSTDFVPGAAAVSSPPLSPSKAMGVAAKPFVPGGSLVNAPVFVPGGAPGSSVAAAVAAPGYRENDDDDGSSDDAPEDEELLLPEMGDLEALGFGVRANKRKGREMLELPPV